MTAHADALAALDRLARNLRREEWDATEMLDAIRAALTPTPLPADLAEAAAQEVKRVTLAWSGPAMQEFKDDPPTAKQRAVAEAVLRLAELRARPTLTAEEARNYLNEDQAVSVEDWHAAYAKLRGIAEGTNHDKEPRSGSEGATS